MKARSIVKRRVKEELKKAATEIRRMKAARKGAQYGYVYGLDSEQREYRRKHVAYCTFFNNTPYEEIETNPEEPLKPSDYSKFVKEFELQVKEAENAEAVRASA